MQSYQQLEPGTQRRLFDAYSSSLLHVSRIYNKAFGYKARKVPAHMPHMVDRDIIYEMQTKFWPFFDATSSHKLRHPQDMQFAFSFNYFVIGVKKSKNLFQLFDEIDTDHSGMSNLVFIVLGLYFFVKFQYHSIFNCFLFLSVPEPCTLKRIQKFRTTSLFSSKFYAFSNGSYEGSGNLLVRKVWSRRGPL